MIESFIFRFKSDGYILTQTLTKFGAKSCKTEEVKPFESLNLQYMEIGHDYHR
jgi:hypothetical protein